MAPSALGNTVVCTAWSLLSLSTFVVSLRLYCRARMIRSVTADDYLMICSLFLAWGLGIINHFQVRYGSGTHMADLSPGVFLPTLQLWYIYQLEYLIVLFFIKCSVLAFYRRLSPSKPYRISVNVVLGVVAMYTVGMLLVNIFECPKKPSLAWSPTFPQGCNDLAIVYFAMASFNIVSDIVILALPIPTVMNLQVNKRKRAALLIVFSCGAVAVIASIVRINALVKYQEASHSPTGDVPYTAAYILLWSQVEVNAAISSASAPALKPLLRSLLGHDPTSSYNSGSRKYDQDRKSGIARLPSGMIPLGSYTGRVRSGTGESEEQIIEGIRRTTEVKVQIQPAMDKKDSEDSLRALEYAV